MKIAVYSYTVKYMEPAMSNISLGVLSLPRI